MRKTNRTAKFKRDYKRETRGQHGANLDAFILEAVFLLANDKPMPDRYQDHNLAGNWKNYCECHLKPDLLLIYYKTDPDELWLVRLGSHSELF